MPQRPTYPTPINLSDYQDITPIQPININDYEDVTSTKEPSWFQRNMIDSYTKPLIAGIGGAKRIAEQIGGIKDMAMQSRILNPMKMAQTLYDPIGAIKETGQEATDYASDFANKAIKSGHPALYTGKTLAETAGIPISNLEEDWKNKDIGAGAVDLAQAGLGLYGGYHGLKGALTKGIKPGLLPTEPKVPVVPPVEPIIPDTSNVATLGGKVTPPWDFNSLGNQPVAEPYIPSPAGRSQGIRRISPGTPGELRLDPQAGPIANSAKLTGSLGQVLGAPDSLPAGEISSTRPDVMAPTKTIKVKVNDPVTGKFKVIDKEIPTFTSPEAEQASRGTLYKGRRFGGKVISGEKVSGDFLDEDPLYGTVPNRLRPEAPNVTALRNLAEGTPKRDFLEIDPTKESLPPIDTLPKVDTSVIEPTLFHGTDPEAAAKIKQSGKFEPQFGPGRKYSYSVLGPDTSYFTNDPKSWWLNKEKAAAGRAISYDSIVEANPVPGAKIKVVNSPREMVGMVKKAGFKNVKEFMSAIDPDNLDYPEKPSYEVMNRLGYNDISEYKNSILKARNAARDAVNRFRQANDVDGLDIRYDEANPWGGRQVAIFDSSKVRPVGPDVTPPPVSPVNPEDIKFQQRAQTPSFKERLADTKGRLNFINQADWEAMQKNVASPVSEAPEVTPTESTKPVKPSIKGISPTETRVVSPALQDMINKAGPNGLDDLNKRLRKSNLFVVKDGDAYRVITLPKESLGAKISKAAGSEVGAIDFSKGIDGQELPPSNIGDMESAIRELAGKPSQLEGKPGMAGSEGFMKQNPELRSAFLKWMNSRAASAHIGLKAADTFDPIIGHLSKDDIIPFQKALEQGKYPEVRKFFDEQHAKMTMAGVPVDYKYNYLPQLWEQTPEAVKAALGEKRLSTQAPFTNESVFKDYEAGMKTGKLTPKMSPSEFIKWYAERSNKLIADTQMWDHLKNNGLIKLKGEEGSAGLPTLDPDKMPGAFGTKGRNYVAPPELKYALENYLQGPNQNLAGKTGRFSGRSAGLTLSGTIFPKTPLLTGHGANIAWSAFQEASPKRFVQTLINGLPHTDEFYAKKAVVNRDWTIHGVENGLNIKNPDIVREPIFKNSTNLPAKTFSKIDKLNDQYFRKPLFDQWIPDTMVEAYKERVMKGIDPARAAEDVNTFYGHLNLDNLFRDKHFQDVAKSFLFAPAWLESRGRLLDLTNPAYQQAAGRVVGLYAAANIANLGSSGKFMWQNDVGHEFDIYAGKRKDGSTRYINLSNAFDQYKVPLEIAADVAKKASFEEVADFAQNKASVPMRIATDVLATRQDRLGNPLITTATDRFGNPVSFGKRLANTLADVSQTSFPPIAKAGINLATSGDLEKSLVTASQAPIRYKLAGNSKAPSLNIKIPKMNFPKLKKK